MRALIFILLFPLIIFSQENDSLWNFDDLEPLVQEEIKPESGKGFFPGLPKRAMFWGIEFIGGFQYTQANNYSSESFAKPTYSFSNNNPDDFTDKFEISDKWDENRNAISISRSNVSLGGSYIYNFSLPFFIEAGVAFEYREDYLLSRLGNQPFLSDIGSLDYFEEYSVVELWEYSIVGSFGVKIPIYGAYFDLSSDDMVSQSIGSFYFLDIKYSPEFILRSRANQFDIITTNKDDIRYQSGYDTLNYSKKQILPDLNQRRDYLNFGIGFLTYYPGFAFETSFNYRMPLNSVLGRNGWKQHVFGFTSELRVRL